MTITGVPVTTSKTISTRLTGLSLLHVSMITSVVSLPSTVSVLSYVSSGEKKGGGGAISRNAALGKRVKLLSVADGPSMRSVKVKADASGSTERHWRWQQSDACVQPFGQS